MQNVVWAGIFVLFLRRFFRLRATALAFIVVFLLGAAGNLDDFVLGGDYVTNFLYVAVAIYLFSRAVEREKFGWISVLQAAFLGVALSSRVVFLVALVPLLAYAVKRTRPVRAVVMILWVCAVWAMVTLPVFAPHPIRGLLAQLGESSGKLRLVPADLHTAVLLPLAGLAVSCAGFVGGMTLARVYLVSGLSILVMMVLPVALQMRFQAGAGRQVTMGLDYVAISALFVGLWIFARFEEMLLSGSVTRETLAG